MKTDVQLLQTAVNLSRKESRPCVIMIDGIPFSAQFDYNNPAITIIAINEAARRLCEEHRKP